MPAERNDMSKTRIFVRTRADGTIVEGLPDGRERPFPNTPMRPMTEAEVSEAAALKVIAQDPDRIVHALQKAPGPVS